jgi:hypothetical protein
MFLLPTSSAILLVYYHFIRICHWQYRDYSIIVELNIVAMKFKQCFLCIVDVRMSLLRV